MALLQERGVEFVTALHQMRKADFSQGQRLGKGDHIVSWTKSVKPDWLDQETFDRLPEQLTVREVEVKVEVQGFRTQSLVVVTSLTDPKLYPKSEIAALYRRRWLIELQLRDIKSTMGLDVLRCKSPEAVRRELWTGLLAYNLIRQSILQSAMQCDRRPDELSFAASLQMLSNTWRLGSLMPVVSTLEALQLVMLRVLSGGSKVVSKRPNRIEPRAVKRRASPLALLTEPRAAAKARLLENHNTQVSN